MDRGPFIPSEKDIPGFQRILRVGIFTKILNIKKPQRAGNSPLQDGDWIREVPQNPRNSLRFRKALGQFAKMYGTRWAPLPVTSRVITPLIEVVTGRGPPCIVFKSVSDIIFLIFVP